MHAYVKQIDLGEKVQITSLKVTMKSKLTILVLWSIAVFSINDVSE